MPYKSSGTASKSASGASMSKYDVEVEARLSKLEAAVAALQSDSHPKGGAANGSQVDELVAILKSSWPGKFANL